MVYQRRKRLTQLVFSGRYKKTETQHADHPAAAVARRDRHDRGGLRERQSFRFPLVGTRDVPLRGRTIDVNKHYPHPQQRWAYDLIIRRDGAVREPGPNVNERHYAYGGTIVSPRRAPSSLRGMASATTPSAPAVSSAATASSSTTASASTPPTGT